MRKKNSGKGYFLRNFGTFCHFIFPQTWASAATKQQSTKLQRKNTIVNDIITKLRVSADEGFESNDPNDYGVCLLKDSPYRILRVSFSKMSIQLSLFEYRYDKLSHFSKKNNSLHC